MKTQTLARFTAGLTLLAVVGASQAASAQAAPAPALTVAGPVIPGVCVFSNERTLQQSTVGKFVIGRLQSMEAAVNTELTPLKTSIQQDGQALQAARTTLAPDVLQQRAVALNQRAANLQRTAEIRDRELQLTQQKAFQRISTELQPAVQQVYNTKNCGLLLDRNSVIAANPTMDITDQVIAALNSRIQQFTFSRETINVPAGDASAAPRAPAATPKRK